jgi:hypothetical protein
MSSYTSISSEKLARLIGTVKAPTLIDVHIDEDFAADPRLIPGATRALGDARRPPVIIALRTHGIEVTALHNHMLDEQPRLFFTHFWANDDAVELAKGLRAALDKTASTKG